jgi:hypothetical protein
MKKHAQTKKKCLFLTLANFAATSFFLQGTHAFFAATPKKVLFLPSRPKQKGLPPEHIAEVSKNKT